MRAGTGLDDQGFFVPEGALSRVRPPFDAVLAAARPRLEEAFADRLDGAYLYGSVPRGTARAGRSDLDLLLVLTREPGPADRAAAGELAAGLDEEFRQIDGAGILLMGRERLLSPAERHDGGWFLACLCTPWFGTDHVPLLPRYRPSSLLARETNGDLGARLPLWRERVARARTDAELRLLCRAFARKLVRTGFTLVMPRLNAWTSELDASALAFGDCYPQRGAQMRRAAAVAREPLADRALLAAFTEDLGPWLAAEYARVHGVKSEENPTRGG
ncbi:nucleotidyltransferase domain-containing protein [Streptomyces physcomitrii]|uniref:nucleotidyltransferase domain-containing protein n=1 Tax=Streptomyces physcomitrii TaxID=2724184 RepID=UPI0033C517A4